MSSTIIYAIDPSQYNETRPLNSKIEVRQATLYCCICSSINNITPENCLTLPTPPGQNIFLYHLIYAGRCLTKECLEKFVEQNKRRKIYEANK